MGSTPPGSSNRKCCQRVVCFWKSATSHRAWGVSADNRPPLMERDRGRPLARAIHVSINGNKRSGLHNSRDISRDDHNLGVEMAILLHRAFTCPRKSGADVGEGVTKRLFGRQCTKISERSSGGRRRIGASNDFLSCSEASTPSLSSLSNVEGSAFHSSPQHPPLLVLSI